VFLNILYSDRHSFIYYYINVILYRLDILTHIKRLGRQLPGTSEEKDYVTDRFTVAESMNLPKVQLHQIETDKEVR